MKKTFTKNYFLHFFLAVGILLGLSSSAFAATIPGEFNGWSKENAVIDNGYTVYLEANKRYRFKIEDWDKWNSYSQEVTKDNCINLEFSQSVKDDAVILTDKAGNYAFKIERWNGSNPVLTVTYPTGDTPVGDIYIPGDFNSWNQTGNQVNANGETTIVLAKGSTYKFKIKVGDQWYGNGGTMTRTNCTDWGFDGNAGDAQISADVSGDYIFKVTMSGGVPRLTVTFPPDASIVVKASKNYRYDSDVDDIVLTATPDKGSYTNYEWQYSLDKSTWTTLTTTTTPTYTLSGANLPKQTMYYRVVGKGTLTIKSLPIIINVLKGCGENTEMKEVFSMDFGTFSNVKDRRDIDNATMAAGYTFRANPKKITDGHYAVVATPYYTGCGQSEGTQGAQYTDKEGDVSEACLKEKAWYRQYLSDNTTFMYDRDYINNGGLKPGEYGGMLMINFLNSIQEPVFVREIKEEEKEHFVNGAVMRFSAWFASAAQPDKSASNQTTIDMTLMIQYYDAANKKWVDASKLTTQVDYADDWVYASTELEIPDRDYTYRVIVTNANASGTGNDVLIDDVMLTVCKPKINVEFDHPTDKEDHTLANTSEKLNVLVANTESGNFGSITDPCIMLFEELTDDAGKVSYQFVDNLVLSADGKNYVTENPIPVDRLFENEGKNLETKPLNLRAVITQREAGTTMQAEWCNTTIKNKVEDATDMTAKPGTDDPFIIFSDNVIVARIECGSAEISDIDGDARIEACELPAGSNERIVLPEITFTPQESIGTEIRYEVTVKDAAGKPLATKEGTWKKGEKVDVSDAYEWVTGIYTVEFSVQEFDTAINPDKPVCAYPATGTITIEIVKLPGVETQIKTDEHGQVVVCDAEEHVIKVEASEDVVAYQWQSGNLKTDDSGLSWVEWADITDATNAAYTIPADAPEDTYYRVNVINRLDCITASDSVKLVRKYCDNLEFKQELDVEGVCLNDVVTYTLWVKNRAAGKAKNVAVSLADIDANLAFDMEEAEIPEGYDPATQTWTIKDELESQEERSISLRFKVVSEPDDRQQPIVIKSYISSLNEGSYGEYDRQPDENLKGEDSVVMNPKADDPTPKRTDMGNDAEGNPIKDEYFAYNMCATETSKVVSFDELIKGDGVGQTYIWLDENKQEIAKEDAWFDAKDPVEDVTLYVYNAPEGYCQSDLVEVHYRVKRITPKPQTKPYDACATETSTMVSLKDYITNADTYKDGYLIITDKDGNEVKEFDASKVTNGYVTYYVTASLDEINSDDKNSCESTAELTIRVKDSVDADDLNLQVDVKVEGQAKDEEDVKEDAKNKHVDIAVCKGEQPTITLTTGKDSANQGGSNQGGSNGTTEDGTNDAYSNITYTWTNVDTGKEYTGSSVYFEPILADEATYKVVASSDALCAAEVQTITFHIKPAISEVTLTPATGEVVIGGDDQKVLTILPAEAEYTAVWHANGKEIEVEENGNIQTTISKPYVDTKYEVTVSGDCNSQVTYEATTTVVWPTVFTPYVLDGLNDTFVQNMNPNFHTLICNRFGMPLVETDNGWDGKLSNGEIAVPGVYYYVVTLPDGNVKKGTIEVYKR